MAKFKVFVVQAEEANGHLFRSLAQVLCYDEPEEMHKSKKFWQAWFSDQIPGEKLTIVAAEGGATIAEQQFVGVVRLWKTPYVENNWYLEGLEVIAPRYRQGIGTALVQKAISVCFDLNVDSIISNVNKDNAASIALHRSLGFKKRSTGALNSWGEYRGHSDEYRLWVEAPALEIPVAQLEAELLAALEKSKIWILATAADGRVSARMVSVVNDGLDIYFQTHEQYAKYEQIQKNKQVALCWSNISIEGMASIVGEPFAAGNEDFIRRFKEHHKSSFENYTGLAGQVVIKVRPQTVSIWKYIGGEPYIDRLDLGREVASRQLQKHIKREGFA
ncbi:MAG TPA: GNAT family N-acetyltransferase [Firmicutes bacterium]|nr:GNAT family N-acetyltransferase [Bacillota bacterium]